MERRGKKMRGKETLELIKISLGRHGEGGEDRKRGMKWEEEEG